MIVELDNPMRRHVYSIPKLILEQLDDLQPKVEKLINKEIIEGIENIILVGCGDSYAAILSIKHFLEENTSFNIFTPSAIEYTRLTPENKLDNNCLVILMSSSGRTSRIVEAAMRSKKNNCRVLSITSNLSSDLAKCSDSILELNMVSEEQANGVREYVSSQIALILLAIELGIIDNILQNNIKEEIIQDIKKIASDFENELAEIDKICLHIAKCYKNSKLADFIGSGYDYAAAYFGQAKMVEATGTFNSINNSEDWLHMSSFVKEPETILTYLVADSRNQASSRNEELIQFITQLTRPFVIITDNNSEFTSNPSLLKITYPSSKYLISKILIDTTPFSLIAGYLAVLNNDEYGRGEKGKYSFTKNGYCVKQSKILVI